RRAHDRLGRDIGARARSVLDDEWLAEPFLQPLSDQARADVGGAAGGEADDDAHRPRRIGLRTRHARDGRQRGSARGQVQELAAGKLHRGPLAEDAGRKPTYSVLTAAALMIGVQRDLVFDQRREGLLTAPGLVRNFAAEAEQALLRILVIERLVE